MTAESQSDEPHPQLEKGEVYLGDMTVVEYNDVPYESKRSGDRMPNNKFPVFALKKEVERHPEMRKGEVLLKCATDREFYAMAWKSKRIGLRQEDGLHPIFVSLGEYLDEMRYILLNKGCSTHTPLPRY